MINVQDVKDFLGITVTTDDDKIMPLCQAAQEEAESYCDRKFDGASRVEYHDGEGISFLQLKNYPIKAITSIYDDLDREFNAEDLIAATDYTFVPEIGVVELIGLVFGNGVRNIKITYEAGYGGTGYDPVPYDLKQALIQLTAAMYLEGKAGVNVFAEQEIVYRPSYLKKEAYKTFDKFRRIA